MLYTVEVIGHFDVNSISSVWGRNHSTKSALEDIPWESVSLMGISYHIHVHLPMQRALDSYVSNLPMHSSYFRIAFSALVSASRPCVFFL